jgi:hypothetical protein
MQYGHGPAREELLQLHDVRDYDVIATVDNIFEASGMDTFEILIIR